MSITSNNQQIQFKKELFSEYKYIMVDQEHGMSHSDYLHFDNRCPSGYEKIRLVSKIQHQVYWLCKVLN